MSQQATHDSIPATQPVATPQDFIPSRLENIDEDLLRKMSDTYGLHEGCCDTSLESVKTGPWDQGHWANRK